MILRKVILGALLALVLPLQVWAVTLVQQNGNKATTAAATTATLTITLPARAAVGDSIGVAFVYTATGTPTLTSVTDDQGNSYTVDQNNSNTGISNNAGAATFLSLTNTPQTISITVGNSASGNIYIFGEVYEVSGATAVDVSATSKTSGSTALNLAFTTTAANEFGFASLSNNSSATYAQNDGWTQDEVDLSNGAYSFHNALPTAGSNSLSATASASSFSLQNVVTFKGSGSGATLAASASDTTSAAGNLSDTRATTVFNPINLGTTPGDGTGDPAKVGMIKVKADLGGLVAGLTRRSTTPGVFGVTSPTGTTTVLNDTSQDWTVNQFVGQNLAILTGPLAGFVEPIASNTATSITVSTALGSAIGSGVGYQIAETPEVNADGYATQAGGTAPATLIDANKSWTVNQWEGFTAHLLSGAYAGQRLQIASNTSNTLKFVDLLNPGVAAGTSYAIGSVVPNLDPELGLRSIQGPPALDLLSTPGFYSLEQTTETIYTLFAATNASTAVSTVGARVRVINVGIAPAVIAPSSNTSGQLINNDSGLTNNEVTLAPASAGVAQYADFQCMLTDSGVTYWAVVTTGTIS
jgi:hypothetical protein